MDFVELASQVRKKVKSKVLDGGFQQRLRISAALIVVCFAYFYRLDKPLLWGDEADTGIEGRNIIRFGYPVAYDGRNVHVYDNGSQLNNNLLPKRIPWTQYYVAAVSLAIFGNNTFGLRLLFAIIGAAAFFPIHAVLKRRVKCPLIVTLLVLLWPQVVLFQRSARYYSILVLLYAIFVWHLSYDFRTTKARFLVALLCFILFYHTHPFAAFCCSVSVLTFCLFNRGKAFFVYLVSSCLGFSAWFVWYKLLGPGLGEDILPIMLIRTNFGGWFDSFRKGLSVAVIDLDAINSFPIILWAGLIIAVFLKGRKLMSNVFKDPVSGIILISLVVQVLGMAAIFGYETNADYSVLPSMRYSILRYMPHLIALATVPLFIVVDLLIREKKLFVGSCILIMVFNPLTLSFWTRPYHRNVPVSWVFPVYSEILQPAEDVWEDIIATVGDKAGSGGDYDKTIVVLPAWTQEVITFYLGDQYVVIPQIREEGTECKQAVRRVIGAESCRRFERQPEWILDILSLFPKTPAGYRTVSVPFYRARPDDGTRPELTRHTFPGPNSIGEVRMYQLLK